MVAYAKSLIKGNKSMSSSFRSNYSVQTHDYVAIDQDALDTTMRSGRYQEDSETTRLMI